MPQPITRPAALLLMRRGLCGYCPSCGEGRLFFRWLKVAPTCRACQAPTGNCRADDAPPYFVLLITGHVVMPFLVWVEENTAWSSLFIAGIFLPLTALMALGLLQPVKGAIIGWMMHLDMHTQPAFPKAIVLPAKSDAVLTGTADALAEKRLDVISS